ncbi:Metallo-dependent hydrolase [Cutaneotrichosporon oleaginosum]|uniref:Metallo-dependent hydrolase n=1 Tax=Cutaneotrichosporon oleaginosum TaxID=879819 RepID=A0A0J0XCR3_9TREE|nr:Metallo-dependent hydrolase [Cutaneotrichosporon oleaginosum]KLT38852.1 Metallo-dependent hydrolase [Cutaneotrichosporon oleaginosum]TXT03977.1 hypothetical protein COLE_07674 [Cutaneotrichosporon oleaginosum]
MSDIADDEYCRRLPKVELHAHLSGSVTPAVLQEIWADLPAAERASLTPPLEALADPTGAQGIRTFFAHFNTYIYRLLCTPGALARATRAVLRGFADDGVVYLELRTTPRALPGAPADVGVRVVLDVIEEWNRAESMPVRLILSVDRAKHGPAEAEAIVDLALALRAEGRPVVGLDVCGDPAAPRPVAALRPAFARARAAHLPCVLHFAEIPASTAELHELLDWRPRRVGHAIHTPPEIVERIVRERVGVEMCLSCNVLAGMLPCAERADARPGIADHHFGEWWRRGGAICLGTDDIGVFASSSSEEHAHAAQHFGLGRADLLELSRRAVAGALDETQGPRVERLLREFAEREGVEWAYGVQSWQECNA